jgi:hypothetical protein
MGEPTRTAAMVENVVAGLREVITPHEDDQSQQDSPK